MRAMGQKNQVELNLGTGAKGEALKAAAQGAEARAAKAGAVVSSANSLAEPLSWASRRSCTGRKDEGGGCRSTEYGPVVTICRASSLIYSEHHVYPAMQIVISNIPAFSTIRSSRPALCPSAFRNTDATRIAHVTAIRIGVFL